MADNTFYAEMTPGKLAAALDAHPDMADWFDDAYQDAADAFRDMTADSHTAAQDLPAYLDPAEREPQYDHGYDVDCSSGRPISRVP